MKSRRTGSLFEDDNNNKRKLTDAEISEQMKPIAALINNMMERLRKLENPRLYDTLTVLLRKHKMDFISLINLQDLTSEKFRSIENEILQIISPLYEDLKETDRFTLLEFDDAMAAYQKLAVALNFNVYHTQENFVSAENPAFSLDAALDEVDSQLKQGQPALQAVQALLQDSEVREKLFDPVYARRFKKDIYKKSIENMARAMISESRELLCKLDAHELYSGKFLSADFAAGTIPTLYPIIQHREKLSYDIAKNIVGSNDIHQAAFAIDYWVNVAYECALNTYLKDIHSAAAIFTTLQISSIYSLFNALREQGLITRQTLARYEKLTAILTHEKNYEARRQHLRNNPECIPAIDYPLTDITTKASITVDVIDPIVNEIKAHQQAAAAKAFNNPIESVNITSKMPAIPDETETKLKDELHQRLLGFKEFIRKANADDVEKEKLNHTQTQLEKITIKGKKALIQDGGLAAQAIPFHRPTVNFKIQTDDPNLQRALKQFNLLGDEHSPSINLLEAVNDICKFNIKSPCLLDASPFIQYLAFIYYIHNTKNASVHAGGWVKALEPKLSIEDPERFRILWDAYSNPDKPLIAQEELDQDNDFVLVSANTNPFPGMKLAAAKNTGANPAGPYGGLYQDINDERKKAMIKRDSKKAKPRCDKIIGEFAAGNISGAVLGEMHQQDDKEYERKYSAKVSLVVANATLEKGEKQDDLVYLRSDIINNNGDLWEFAFIKLEADALYQRNPGVNQEDEKAKYKAALVEGKKIVRKKYNGQRPAASIPALFGYFDTPIIKVPCDLLLSDEALLNQFCEMSAARALVGDMGLHSGNFVVFIDEKTHQLHLGSFDFGAAFDEFTPTVLPFKYKEKWLELYKNHLREYDPRVIYSKNMALALIKVGRVSEDRIKIAIEKTMNEVAIPYSIGPIKEFCARMGMAKEKYDSIENKGVLLQVLRDELERMLLLRKTSMMQQGFGLLLENCFIQHANGDIKLDEKQLESYLHEHPELGEFIDNDLVHYQCVKPNQKDMQQIITAKNNLRLQAEQRTKLQQNLDLLFFTCMDLQGQFTRHLDALTNTKNMSIAKFGELAVKSAQLAKAAETLESMIITISYRDIKTEDDHRKYKDLMREFGAITRSIEKVNQFHAKSKQEQERKQKRQTMLAKPYVPDSKPAVVVDQPSVLTLAMLGTNEHHDNGDTILTQLCQAIQTGPKQSVYLIDGPGGEPTKANYLDPRLGTYTASNCERDPITGIITVKKTLKTENIPGRLRAIMDGAGSEDAIAEALMVVDTMLQTSTKPLILNLTGFSRGADNILRLANELAARYRRDELVVNLFALDPVAGPLRTDATRARLIPDIVANYEAIFMTDESRKMFEPQDMRRLAVQNANLTKQTLHLYRGVHTDCNYFNVNGNGHTTRLAWDDMTKFAQRHGAALNTDKFDYVQFGTNKKAKATALQDTDRLAAYTAMLNNESESKPKYQRDFTAHIYDYCLHHGSYFLDHQHMMLFKEKYPYLFDRLFQRGVQFASNAEAEGKITEEMKSIRDTDSLLAKSLERLNGDNRDKKVIDFSSEKIPPKRGIYLVADQFYQPDNRLHVLWKGVQATMHPILKGIEKTCPLKDAEGIYQKIRGILESKDTEKDKILKIAACLTELRKHAKNAPLLGSKIDALLENAGVKLSNTAKQPKAAGSINTELNAFLASHPDMHAFYKNVIIKKLHTALKQLEDNQLGNDFALINELLTTACQAIQLAKESGLELGPVKLIKKLRTCMLAATAALPAPAYTAQQKAAIQQIMDGFRNHLLVEPAAPAAKATTANAAATTPLPVAGLEPIPTEPSPPRATSVKAPEMESINRMFKDMENTFITMNHNLDRLITREQSRLDKMKREVNPTDVKGTMYPAKEPGMRREHLPHSEPVKRAHHLKRSDK